MKYGLFRTLSAAGMAALEISAEPNQMKRGIVLPAGRLCGILYRIMIFPRFRAFGKSYGKEEKMDLASGLSAAGGPVGIRGAFAAGRDASQTVLGDGTGGGQPVAHGRGCVRGALPHPRGRGDPLYPPRRRVSRAVRERAPLQRFRYLFLGHHAVRHRWPARQRAVHAPRRDPGGSGDRRAACQSADVYAVHRTAGTGGLGF